MGYTNSNPGKPRHYNERKQNSFILYLMPELELGKTIGNSCVPLPLPWFLPKATGDVKGVYLRQRNALKVQP